MHLRGIGAFVNQDRAIKIPGFEPAPLAAGNPTFGAAGRLFAPLLAIVGVLTALRLTANAFANTELFFDEAQYWFWSRELAFGYYSKPPLIAWIIRGATEICGDSEACIRTPSALFHAGTALAIHGIGKLLFDQRIGFWSGLAYATLPGVTLSSTLISTDAPLLFFVATALWSYLKLADSRSWLWAGLFGAAIGFGFLSKYAMAYFLICMVLAQLGQPKYRRLWSDARFYAGLAIGAAILAPNILWNTQNGFATLSHTADNANWGDSLLHPVAALEFIGGQFGVFGPIFFAAFLLFCISWLRDPAVRARNAGAAALLLTFAVPVILLMTFQALLSRAHANWAAFAYVAATVLMTGVLLREGWTRLFQASLALHLAVFVLVSVGGILAGRISLPGGSDPYARVLGWKALAEAAAEQARAGGFKTIATDKRALAAELFYYLREEKLEIVALGGGGRPRDHFELTRPLTSATPRPVLLVSFTNKLPDNARAISVQKFPAGLSSTRQVYFYKLD